MLDWILRNKGKLLILYTIKILLFIPTIANATVYTDNFDSYTDGSALQGQGQWVNFGLTGSNFNVVATTSASSSPNTIQTGGNNRNTGINYDVGTTTRVKFDYWWQATGGTQSNNIAQLGGYIDSAGALTTFSRVEVLRSGVVECNGFSGGCANGLDIATLNHGWNAIQFDLTRVSSTSVIYKVTVNDIVELNATTTLATTYNRFFPRISTLFSSASAYDNYEFYTDGDIPLEPFEACNEDPTTRIIDFAPEDGSTQSNTVTFSLNACVNSEDIGTIKGVSITLHNIDQNVLLLGSLSPSDIYLLDNYEVTTAGLFSYSSTTSLGDGNYRIKVCIERFYFFSFITNIFSPISDCESQQFIVNNSTFIGNISQNIYGETNDFFEGLTATSSEALANTCNLLSANFGIRECTAFLFIPDASGLNESMTLARDGILSRVPWGYFTRVVSILNNPATSTIQSFTTTIQIGSGDDMTPETTTITIDPADMLAGGASLLESIQDPITNKTPRDVFYPMVQLTVALAVLMTIIADLTRSHDHANNEESRKGKLS